MEQSAYNLSSLVVQIITAIAAGVFAFWQILINRRLKKLQDYVAISTAPFGMQLQIMNVGKINLYLHKYEIGTATESYSKPLLIPVGNNAFLLVPIKSHVLDKNMNVKLYLIDELGEKYFSEGEVMVKEITIPQPIVQGTLQSEATAAPATEPIRRPQATSAWSYKTVRSNWKL